MLIFTEGDKLAHALGNDGRPLGYKPKFNKPRTKGNVLDAIVMDGTVPSSLDPMKYKKGALSGVVFIVLHCCVGHQSGSFGDSSVRRETNQYSQRRCVPS